MGFMNFQNLVTERAVRVWHVTSLSREAENTYPGRKQYYGVGIQQRAVRCE